MVDACHSACIPNPYVYSKRDQRTSVPCAGLDSADLISQLRASHAHDAQSRLGVDVLSGGAGDMSQLGIFESFKVRSEAFRVSFCGSPYASWLTR